MDKSQEFIKSGKKLISEYDADAYYEEKEEKKPEFLKIIKKWFEPMYSYVFFMLMPVPASKPSQNHTKTRF